MLLPFAILSCKKKEIYPETPQVEFKSAFFIQDQLGIDSIMVLSFTFKDGDGDLGLNQSDTIAPFNAVTDSTGKSLNPYYNNIHFGYEERINGEFKFVTNPFNVFDTLNYAYRFENISPDGRHKAIRGDIEVKIGPNQYPNAGDTCRYKFFIYDRALHKSNLAETPSLVWKRR
jgi:hypothetical protein